MLHVLAPTLVVLHAVARQGDHLHVSDRGKRRRWEEEEEEEVDEEEESQYVWKIDSLGSVVVSATLSPAVQNFRA